MSLASLDSKPARHGRLLSLPRVVANVLPLGDDGGEGHDVKRVILLETCCLYISRGEMYMVPLSEAGPAKPQAQRQTQAKAKAKSHEQAQAEPQLVQSYVLDGCGLHGSTSSKALILTAEYSVLLFELDSSDNSAHFSEIHESFLAEEEVEQLAFNFSARAQTEMFADFARGLVVVMSQLRILVMSVQELDSEAAEALPPQTKASGDKFEGRLGDSSPPPQHSNATTFRTKDGKSLHVRGSRFIEVSLQKPLKVDDLSEEKIELASALTYAATTFSPIIEHCAVWGGEGATSIACAGNGSWLQLFAICKDGVSEIWKSLEVAPFLDVDDAGFASSCFPEMVRHHSSWITALSKGSRSTICASGDASGGVLVWMPDEKTNRFVKTYFSPNFCNSHRVAALYNDDSNNALWVSDTSGLITLAFFDISSRGSLEKIRAIKVFPSGCGATFLQWKERVDAEQEVRGRLRAACAETGVCIECFLHDSISTIISTPVEPAFEPGHRSLVEVCCVLPEFELVVTAGCGDKASVWDLKSLNLVATIISPDRFFTSLCSFDSGFVSGGFAKIICGHANGHTHEFVISYQKRETEEAQDSIVQHVEVGVGESKSQLVENGSFKIADSRKEPSILLERPSLDENKHSKPNRDQIIKVGHQSSTEYVPLPVTQIVTSTLGLFYAFCYAQSCVVVHNWEDKRALAQIQFDQTFVEISTLKSTSFDDAEMEADSLILVLQGQHNVKLFDALRGQILTSFDLGTNTDSKVASSALWDIPIPSSPDEGHRRILGLCAANGPSVFAFGELTGVVPLQISAPVLPLDAQKGGGGGGGEDDGELVDGLVRGCQAFEPGYSPFASVWTLRSVYWFRMMLENAEPEVLRVQQYNVPSDKVRVVLGKSLKMVGRSHRLLVVLSDGTISTLTL